MTFEDVVKDIHLPAEYAVDYWHAAVTSSENLTAFRIAHFRPDAVTGIKKIGYGGTNYILTDAFSESIVKAVFKAWLAYEEHEVRERFIYKGARIFGPHIKLSALASVADQIV